MYYYFRQNVNNNSQNQKSSPSICLRPYCSVINLTTCLRFSKLVTVFTSNLVHIYQMA